MPRRVLAVLALGYSAIEEEAPACAEQPQRLNGLDDCSLLPPPPPSPSLSLAREHTVPHACSPRHCGSPYRAAASEARISEQQTAQRTRNRSAPLRNLEAPSHLHLIILKVSARVPQPSAASQRHDTALCAYSSEEATRHCDRLAAESGRRRGLRLKGPLDGRVRSVRESLIRWRSGF